METEEEEEVSTEEAEEVTEEVEAFLEVAEEAEAEEAEEELEEDFKLLLNLMKGSLEFSLSEEKKMLSEQKTLHLESLFTKKREFQFRNLEKKRKLNTEHGTHSDQKLLLPL